MDESRFFASDPPVVLQQRYRLAAILGKGSLGMAYRAMDAIRSCDVVIKFIEPAHDFEHDLKIAQQLEHPQIAALHSLEHEADWSFLVLELSAGRTLRRVLRERGRLSANEALELIHSLLAALAYLHSHGLIHRNLKPENLMLADDRRVKIMDVGIGLTRADPRLVHSASRRTSYYAPELLDAAAATIQSDLYAVGAIWCELLTGQPPTLPAVINDSSAPVVPLLISDIPSELEQIIMQLRAPNPSSRYQSAEAVLHALTRVTLFEQIPNMDQPSRIAIGRLQKHIPVVPQSPDPRRYSASEDPIIAVEAERKHLASLLQQQLAEPLHLLLSQANAYEQSLSGQPIAQIAVSVLATLARQVLQQLRDLEADLHPQVLETLGLAPALELLAGQFMRATNAHIRLTLQGIPERLPIAIELAIFRATQAALSRAIHSAHATHITIRLEQHDSEVRYSVQDNGVGETNSEFLQSACQRIEQLGGSVKIGIESTGSFELVLLFARVVMPILTSREIEVLQLLTEGFSNKQIATRLVVSTRTVNFHLDNIYTKLNVNTRTEASLVALRMGWVNQGKHKP